MNKFIFILFSIIFILSSCKKENEEFDFGIDNGFPSIAIDTLKYTYISEDGDHFYKGYFINKNNVQSYNLRLEANRKYRISASQAHTTYSSIDLCLFSGSDTVTISSSIGQTDAIYFNTSKAGDFILKARLKNVHNLSLDYYLYFEELEYAPLTFNDYQFSYRGHFENEIDNLVLYPSYSSWHNWLKVDESIPYTSDISYKFKSEELSNNNAFGFMLAATEQPEQIPYMQSDLPLGVYFSIKNQQYSIKEYSNNYVSTLSTGDLPSNLDLSQTVEVDIITTATYSNYKQVLINAYPVTYIEEASFNSFYMVFDDRLEKAIQISDFKIVP